MRRGAVVFDEGGGLEVVPSRFRRRGCSRPEFPERIWNQRTKLIMLAAARTREMHEGQQIRGYSHNAVCGSNRRMSASRQSHRWGHGHKKPRICGAFKRLKGLEPSTFCMAIGMASAGIWPIYLQIR